MASLTCIAQVCCGQITLSCPGRLQLTDYLVQCRFIIYKEKLEEKIDVISPKEVGGLKSPQYLALNKQGKCPALIVPQPGGKPLCIAESEVCPASGHQALCYPDSLRTSSFVTSTGQYSVFAWLVPPCQSMWHC